MQTQGHEATFQLLLDELKQRTHAYIAQGAATERALALQAGISQSHLHNVLKGIRTLTPPVADRLLGVLRLSVTDLEAGRAHPKAGKTPPAL